MRRVLRLPLLLGFLIACGGMVVGSWNGGETVYQHGTSVLIINSHGKTQEMEKLDSDATQYEKIVGYYIGGEEQVHIIVAGFALSAIVAALGLSIRRLTTHRAEDAAHAELRLAGHKPGGRGGADDLSVIRSLNPETAMEAEHAHVPVGRWWFVAILVTLCTSAAGYWILSRTHFADQQGWSYFVKQLQLDDAQKWKISRHLAHAALGTAMVLLALILACVTRWAPRASLVLSFFATLLVLVIAAQVWMGIALTFEGEGPLTHFETDTGHTDSSATSPSSNSDAPATTQESPATLPAETPSTSATKP
jgi:hypothetical protein